jgi:hypothetical protein
VLVERRVLRCFDGAPLRPGHQEGTTPPSTGPHWVTLNGTKTSGNGPAHHGSASTVRIDTEEVTSSILVSPTGKRPGQELLAKFWTGPFGFWGLLSD